MSTLVSLITTAGYADRILTTQQLRRILGGSDDRRYGQVKRALKSGSLIRVRRGLYVLAESYRTQPVHPFALAQVLVIGSYVSMETALALHGWIPETVYTTVSVTPDRKTKEIEHTQFGRFEFKPLPIHKREFLTGVRRHVISGQAILAASPLRALMDLVAYRKQKWSGIDWVLRGMRVDETSLIETRLADFLALEGVYKHQTASAFLTMLEMQVRILKASQTSARRAASR